MNAEETRKMLDNLNRKNNEGPNNIDKAKKIFEQYNYSYRDMVDDGIYEEYKTYNIPRDMENQWLMEAFEKNKTEFQKSCEAGNPDFEKLQFICKQANTIDKNIIKDTYNMVINNLSKMEVENQLMAFSIISAFLMVGGIVSNVGLVDFKYVLEGIIEKTNSIFQSHAELQPKYQYICDDCIAAIDYFGKKK